MTTATALIFAGMVLIAVAGGAFLGHWFTLRSIAHVQPPASAALKSLFGGVTTEADPWAGETKAEMDEKEAEERRNLLKKMGLNPEVVDPDRFFGENIGTMKPAGVGAGKESHES